jgi:hypothetical protein
LVFRSFFDDDKALQQLPDEADVMNRRIDSQEGKELEEAVGACFLIGFDSFDRIDDVIDDSYAFFGWIIEGVFTDLARRKIHQQRTKTYFVIDKAPNVELIVPDIGLFRPG